MKNKYKCPECKEYVRVVDKFGGGKDFDEGVFCAICGYDFGVDEKSETVCRRCKGKGYYWVTLGEDDSEKEVWDDCGGDGYEER